MATVNTLWEHLCGSAYFPCPLWRLRLNQQDKRIAYIVDV